MGRFNSRMCDKKSIYFIFFVAHIILQVFIIFMTIALVTEEGSWTLSNGFWPLPLCLCMVVLLKISEYKDQKRIRYTAIVLSVLLTCIDFVAMVIMHWKW